MALWATLPIAIVVSVTLVGSWLQLSPQRDVVKVQTKLSGVRS